MFRPSALLSLSLILALPAFLGCEPAEERNPTRAERIRQFDWFEPGPDEEGVDFVVRRGSGRARSRPTPTHENHNTTLWYEGLRDLEGGPAQATGGETPILLLGDSFSVVYSHPRGSDLVRLIYARLGWKINAILVKGGGTNSV